jgi:hypothetical protein
MAYRQAVTKAKEGVENDLVSLISFSLSSTHLYSINVAPTIEKLAIKVPPLTAAPSDMSPCSHAVILITVGHPGWNANCCSCL